MSKAICTDAIEGAYQVVDRADALLARAIAAFGADKPVSFPDTAYYLPIIYSFTGRKVEKLGDLVDVLQECHNLLPQVPAEKLWLPYLGDALDAGAATLFAFEAIEACKTVLGPHPVNGIWLGAANDVIMRERGVEFVDGTAPGFAAVIGAAPDGPTAVRIARELQQKNLYVFMAGAVDGRTFAEQLVSEGVQLGWETRLVPFGPDVSAVVYALGFANRAALSFGGVAPGDFEHNLRYNKNRIFAFVLALGMVDQEKYAAAAGAINYGFPTIADTDIPQILPTGVCTYEHVVSSVPHEKIVEKALEVRGCKVKITAVPIPVPYGPAFEGERIRKAQAHVEFGGNITPAFEFVTMVDLDSINDGEITVVGPDIDEIEPGAALPLAIWVEVAGRKMQSDFEPILERQIHHLLNEAEGIWHIGQRDILWSRVSKAGFDKGLRLRHFGEILHAKFLDDYPAIVDKVKVTLFTDRDEVELRREHAREVYRERNHRLATMTDETVDTFYSCLLCQSFAPNHVCMITPERLGLCGAYNWLDGKAAYEIDETGPNQPVLKGRCLDEQRGIWEEINNYVYKNSHKSIDTFTAYSLMSHPMTSCGCFECIVAYVPECNGVMAVNREFLGNTPIGMTFSTLAGMVGGGVQTPGFMGVGKAFLSSRKFIAADGGIRRVVWLPKGLKEIIAEDFKKRLEEEGIPELWNQIADETIATEPDAIREYLQKVGHPALEMPDLGTLWGGAEKEGYARTMEPPERKKEKSEAGPVRPAKKPSGQPSQGILAELKEIKRSLMDEVKSSLLVELKEELKKELRGALSEVLTAMSPGAAPAPPPPAAAPGEPEAKPQAPPEAPVITAPAVSEEKPAAPKPKAPEESPRGEPAREAVKKLAAVKAFEIPREPPGETIERVTLGATEASGGTRKKTIILGGQNCLPFHSFEGDMAHPPVFALEVFDSASPKLSPVLREAWGELLGSPAEMARKAVQEYGAEAISLRLESTHPEKGGKSPEEALALVQEVLAVVDVPIIVTAHNHFETANEVMKKVAAGCAGERLLLNWVEGENYRTIAGMALAYGHCVVAQSPIDVNLAKQLNILLTNMDLPRDRIVMDPMTGALGYGLEYTFSVMERIRLTGLGGDTMLTFPLMVSVGQEAWKVKEGSAGAADFPAWGDLAQRAVLWEVQTAVPLILAGGDLVLLYHPQSLAVLRRNVAKLAARRGGD